MVVRLACRRCSGSRDLTIGEVKILTLLRRAAIQDLGKPSAHCVDLMLVDVERERNIT